MSHCEAGAQRLGKGQHVDHRELRGGVPAEPEQRERQEAEAQPEPQPAAPDDRVLEHQDAGQREQRGGEHRDVARALPPYLLPERPGPLGDRLGRLDHIARGQSVGPGKARVGGLAGAGPTLDQQLQAPGLLGHEAAILRQREQRELAQLRCPLDRQRIDPPVLGLGQLEGALALDQLDPIEGALTPPRRALERVQAAPADEDQLIALGEIAHRLAVEALAQQVAADAGGRREPEDTARPAWRRARDRHPRERAAHPFPRARPAPRHAQLQWLERAVLDQRRPVERRVARDVDPGRAEQAAGAGDGARGADDRIVDHGRGDGRPAHRIDLARPGRGPRHLDRLANVHAPILVDERLQVLVRDPDHQDRLVLLEDRGAGDPGLQIEPHQDIERLARVADRLHDLARMQHVADQLVVPVCRRRGRIARRRPDPLAPGHHLAIGSSGSAASALASTTEGRAATLAKAGIAGAMRHLLLPCRGVQLSRGALPVLDQTQGCGPAPARHAFCFPFGLEEANMLVNVARSRRGRWPEGDPVISAWPRAHIVAMARTALIACTLRLLVGVPMPLHAQSAGAEHILGMWYAASR